MAVATTPTASDKFEEVRKLNGEIALLKSQKEIHDRAKEESRTAAEDAESRRVELENEIIDLQRIVQEAGAETSQFLTDCRAAIAESTEKLNEVIAIYKKGSEVLVKTLGDIKLLQARKDALHNSIVKENEEIERKRKDLDIYHKRVTKLYEEHMPDQQPIL